MLKKKRRLVAYPEQEVAKDFARREADLIHDLEHIATNLIGPYVLDPAAKQWGTDWYEKHYEANRENMANDRFSGYIARKQTHMHKLAIVLAASESDTRTILPAHLQAADRAITGVERNFDKVFERITAPDARNSNELRQLVRKAGNITVRNARRIMFAKMNADQFGVALQSCREAGYVQVTGGTIRWTGDKD